MFFCQATNGYLPELEHTFVKSSIALISFNNGATLEEIFEALFQVAVYAGFPAAWDALSKLEEVLAEIDD